MPPAPPSRSSAHARESLLELLSPVVAHEGYDLEDVTVTSAGRRTLIRVSVDADDGIDLDAIAAVSRVVSDRLDAADAAAVVPGPYVLEVSSPGVDRPLTETRHWRRAVGRLVSVPVAADAAKTTDTVKTTVTGRLLGVDDTGVSIEVDGRPRALTWGTLGPGRVQVEFNRAEAGEE